MTRSECRHGFELTRSVGILSHPRYSGRSWPIAGARYRVVETRTGHNVRLLTTRGGASERPQAEISVIDRSRKKRQDGFFQSPTPYILQLRFFSGQRSFVLHILQPAVAGRRMQHGPFHRKENQVTQTRADAIEQCRSGEIWGRVPQNGFCLTVQAYAGQLRNNYRGINFTTDTEPAPNGVLDRNSPYDVRWYLGITPGVLKRVSDGEDFACIRADVVNCQP